MISEKDDKVTLNNVENAVWRLQSQNLIEGIYQGKNKAKLYKALPALFTHNFKRVTDLDAEEVQHEAAKPKILQDMQVVYVSKYDQLMQAPAFIPLQKGYAVPPTDKHNLRLNSRQRVWPGVCGEMI